MDSPTPIPSPPFSSTAETLVDPNYNRTIDLFDEVSSEDEDSTALESVSEISEYPAGSVIGIKSPKRHREERFRAFPDSFRVGSSTSTSSPCLGTEASTRAMKSPGGSTSSTGSLTVDGRRKSSIDAVLSTMAIRANGGSPTRSPGQEDSPTLGRFPVTTTAAKAAQAQAQAATISTGTCAERGLHVSLASKFLRSTTHANGMEEDEGSNEIQGSQGGRRERLNSVFESDSSNGEEREEPVVADATRASVQKPNLVDHRQGNRVVGIKEMLRDDASIPAENNPGPSRLKAAMFLGEPVEALNGLDVKRAGIVGIPTATDWDGLENAFRHPITTPEVSPKKVDAWINPINNLTDGLRSNPVNRAATVPSSRRKVTFPPPPSIEVKPEHRFLRQSIVSTPYPLGHKKEGQPENAEALRSATPDRPTRGLTMVLYSNNNHLPKIKKVTVPNPEEKMLVDSDGKKPEFRAIMKRDFDDEGLFRFIHAEFLIMRGGFRKLTSARCAHGIRLLSYRHLSQLALRYEAPVHRTMFQVHNGVLAQQRMLELYQNPKLGRGAHEWTEWIKTRVENTEGESAEDDEDIAVELVEDWCIRKITLMMAAVLVSSLAAILLWTFLGVGDSNRAEPGQTHEGFRGAAGRVETGAVLGVLVLMFGWTTIGAWVFLSWLII